MLDKLPPELCARIFQFACTDSGYTGRSLSLVSRYIHETSQPAKLQSIALVGRKQILDFAVLLSRTPAHLRTTRYLFVNGQETKTEWKQLMDEAYGGPEKAAEYRRKCAILLPPDEVRRMQALQSEIMQEEDKANRFLDRFGAEGARAVESILRGVGPTLELLDVALNEHVAMRMSSTLSLPRLLDLTTRCSFPLEPMGGTLLLAPCPSLHRLHIVEVTTQRPWTTSFFKNGISQFAPALTHLRLSGLRNGISALIELPATLQQVVIKPGVPPASNARYMVVAAYRQLLHQARELRDLAPDVVVLRRADDHFPTQDVYYREWVEKAAGGPSDWDVSDLDEVEA